MRHILVAHALSHRMRSTTVEFVMGFGRYAPDDARVTYHNVRKPVGRDVKGREFDAVILPYDVLSLRSSRQWEWVLDALNPLAEAADTVIALPQDDYTFNDVLDEGLERLKVDVIFTPIETGLELVYPRMHRKARIRHALTGYVDETTVANRKHTRVPITQRPIDVGQRVRMLPAWFGRKGLQKGLFAERFKQRAGNSGLVLDISTRDEDAFSGDDWYNFLGSCRATIGQKGGASLCDPDGSIMETVVAFQEAHPEAGFDEIEAACFPGLDGRAEMSAISPRLFDAAMLGTAQVLVEDDYLGVMQPWVHYVPTDQQLSNLDELTEAIKDHQLLSDVARAAEEVLIDSGAFTYRRFVEGVFESEVLESNRPVASIVGVDVADELQWRLSPDLFEAAQRCANIAWATHSTGVMIELIEEVEDLLEESPDLVSHFDLGLLQTIVDDVHVSHGLDALMAPFIDVVTSIFKVGALRAYVAWLRFIDQSDVQVWQLLDWIDKERIELDAGVFQ